MRVRLALVQLAEDSASLPRQPLGCSEGSVHALPAAELAGTMEAVPAFMALLEVWMLAWQWAWFPFALHAGQQTLPAPAPSGLPNDRVTQPSCREHGL